jgi:hypothetical protein
MYASLIGNAIGTTDPATAAVVEDLMRTNRTGLDDLDPAQFARLARTAYADVALLAAAGELGTYCDALGLETPSNVRI